MSRTRIPFGPPFFCSYGNTVHSPNEYTRKHHPGFAGMRLHLLRVVRIIARLAISDCEAIVKTATVVRLSLTLLRGISELLDELPMVRREEAGHEREKSLVCYSWYTTALSAH